MDLTDLDGKEHFKLMKMWNENNFQKEFLILIFTEEMKEEWEKSGNTFQKEFLILIFTEEMKEEWEKKWE